MDMLITFPGGARVNANYGQFTVATDQPPQGGGEGSAPSPFALFLAAIGTCAGIYVLRFLQQRELPTEDVRIMQRLSLNPSSGMVEQVELEIQVPPEIPEKHHQALIRAAQMCAVKKHLEQPPQFKITASIFPESIG